jgi:hypothetical protein
MKAYALFKDPPFTTQQLDALLNNDVFPLIPWWDIFKVEPTPLDEALRIVFSEKEEKRNSK